MSGVGGPPSRYSVGSLAFAALLLVPLLCQGTTAQAGGDIRYTSSTDLRNVILPVRGNITVEPGATVTITDGLVLFQGPGDGQRWLWVKPGATLRLVRTTIQGDPAAFDLRAEGNLVLDNSTLKRVHDLKVGTADERSNPLSPLAPVLPAGRDRAGAASNGRYTYVFGGHSLTRGALNEIVRFTHANGKVELLPAMLPSARSDMATAWDGSTAFLAGGASGTALTSQIVRFDSTTQTVTVMKASLPSARTGASAAWTPNGVVIVGGQAGSGLSSEIYLLDPKADMVFPRSPSLTTPRAYTSSVWTGRHVLIFGGQTDAGATGQILRYDPASDSLGVAAASLPAGLFHTSAVWDGKYAYVFGGTNGTAYSGAIYQYDPQADAVTTMHAALPTPRTVTSAVWSGSEVFLLGGRDAQRNYTTLLRYESRPASMTAAASIVNVTGTFSTEYAVRALEVGTSSRLDLANTDYREHRIQGTDISFKGGSLTAASNGLTLRGGATWVGEALKVTAKGVPLQCLADSHLRLKRTDVVSTHGTALLAIGCDLTLTESTLAGTGELGAETVRLASGTTKWSSVRVTATTGTGVLLDSAAKATFDRTTLNTAHEAITASQGSSISGSWINATSAQRSAVSCAASTLQPTSGRWTGVDGALRATDCDGTVRGVEFSSTTGPAVRSSATGPRALTLAGFKVPRSGSPALELRGSATVQDADGTGHARFIDWSRSPGALGVSEVRNVASRSSSECAVCVSDGDFAITGLNASGPTVGLRAKNSQVALADSQLSAAQTPLHLTDSQVRAQDTALRPENHTLVGGSLLEAFSAFRPVAALKNGAPVEGATVVISALNGTELARGTTGILGYGPSHTVRALRQEPGAPPQKAPDMKVRAELRTSDVRTFNTVLRLSPLAPPFTATLWDNETPTDLGGLRLTSPPNQRRTVAIWNASTDDFAAPAYRAELFIAPGQRQILVGSQQVNFTSQVLSTSTDRGLTFDLPGQGAFVLTVTPIDASGNRGKGRSVGLVWDETRPDVTYKVSGPAGDEGWHRGDVTVQLDVKDHVSPIQSILLLVDGQPVANASRATALTRDGIHDLEATVTDAAGNVAVAVQRIKLDRSPPRVPAPSLERTVFSLTTRVPVQFAGEPQDDLSGVAELQLVRTDNASAFTGEVLNRFFRPYPTEASVDLAPGIAYLRVVAVDRAGNAAGSDPLRVVVDLTPPRLAEAPPTTLSADTVLRLHFEDDTRVVSSRVYVDGVLWGSGPTGDLEVDLGGAGRGTHSVRIVATDEAGNVLEETHQVTMGGGGKSPAWGSLAATLAVVAAAVLQRGRKTGQSKDTKELNQ